MPKSLVMNPEMLQNPGKIEFRPVSVFSCQDSVKDVKDSYSKADWKNMYRDMFYIRAFEEMISKIKRTEKYEDLEYYYPGPVHLCPGEEAVCVGAAYYQTENDYCFGSHRSHGENIAKGLRVVATMDEAKLQTIMENYREGIIYNFVKTPGLTIKENAVRFVLFGLLCEIFGKKTGFNSGLCGSMHSFFKPFGMYPCNAIVGGSSTIAVGAAMYKMINHEPGVTICNLGDGATATGSVYEAVTLATMDQYKTLWGEHGGNLPVIFNVTNNFYAQGDQTAGETMSVNRTATIPVGLSDTQLYSERVNGMNLVAVLDAYRRCIPLARQNGPVWLDCVTYRYFGHNLADANTYRTKEEIESWKSIDPIKMLKKQLVEAAVCDLAELDTIEKKVYDDIYYITGKAIKAPDLDLSKKDRDGISKYVFSNQRYVADDKEKSVMLKPFEDGLRVKSFEKRMRYAIDSSGKTLSKAKVYQIRDAIAEPIIKKMYEDPKMIIFGEDVRDFGGSYGVYKDFLEIMPYHRLFNMPISECAIIGAAVGYAMCGGHVIAEIMYDDFSARAADELFNQLAKWQAMSAGEIKLPVIVRMSIGSNYGAQHTQDWTALYAHIPGLKVVYPVTPYDAKGLMEAALNGTDPVIFLESQVLYDTGELFHTEGVPEKPYEIEIGDPDVKRVGNDVTIISIGAALYRCLEAADILKSKYNVSAEVINARSIVPLNYEKIVESVKKTGRVVVVGDGCERNSIMRHIASKITEFAFNYLDGPPCVLGAKNWLAPTYELTNNYFPQAAWIVDIIHEKLIPLENYIPENDFTIATQMEESKLGI